MTLTKPVVLLLIGSIAASTLTLLGIIPVNLLLIAKSIIGLLFQFELVNIIKGN